MPSDSDGIGGIVDGAADDTVAPPEEEPPKANAREQLCQRMASEVLKAGNITQVTKEVVDRACFCGNGRLDEVEDDGTHVVHAHQSVIDKKMQSERYLGSGQDQQAGMTKIAPADLDAETQVMRKLWLSSPVELRLMMTAPEGEYAIFLECGRVLREVVKGLVNENTGLKEIEKDLANLETVKDLTKIARSMERGAKMQAKESARRAGVVARGVVMEVQMWDSTNRFKINHLDSLIRMSIHKASSIAAHAAASSARFTRMYSDYAYPHSKRQCGERFVRDSKFLWVCSVCENHMRNVPLQSECVEVQCDG